jgi:hypothetical protein
MKSPDHDYPDPALPETALDALARYDGPVLLDLDETLYLRSSTEDFIDTARPAFLAFVLLKLMDLVAPWRWTGGRDTRDGWRVKLIGALFPWVWPTWRARCGTLAEHYGNRHLLSVLKARSALPIVTTLGFLPVVTPLVNALGLAGARIVAVRVNCPEDRVRGKLALAVDALGEDVLRQSMVISDSVADRPLFDRCARPLLVIWPEARFRPAFTGLYLPGKYLLKIKRPDDRLYIVRTILWEDFALWLLCSIWLAALPMMHLIGLLLLLVSFWAVYERGYVDNDLVAQRYEADPTLSPAFGTSEVATPILAPWLWAAACGILGVIALRWPFAPGWHEIAVWAAVLAATWGWFWIYNRLDKSTRVWLYLGLQLARSAAFMALVPVVAMAPAAVSANVVSKWLPYILYRTGGQASWPGLPTHLVRLLCFAAFTVTVVLAVGPSVLVQASFLALLLFFGIKARREVLACFRMARRIDGESAPESDRPLGRTGIPIQR